MFNKLRLNKISSELACAQGVVAVTLMLIISTSPVSAEETTSVTGDPIPLSAAQSQLGQPVPDSVIVLHNGLEWVWASPCALNGCTAGIDVGHDGFNFATPAQWAQRPPVSGFGDPVNCASPWFDHTHNHCDLSDAVLGEFEGQGTYGSAPTGQTPSGNDGTLPMHPAAETWLVRETTIPVGIDIKPGSDPNSINLCSNGAIPVAILGSDTFDVSEVNSDTLRFAEAAVKVVGKKDPQTLCSYSDVNLDGFTDLVCHFLTTDIAALDGASTSASVNGELIDGTPKCSTKSQVVIFAESSLDAVECAL